MDETNPVKVNADLTPLNKGQVECDAVFHSYKSGQPLELSIDITELSVENINSIINSSNQLKTIFGNSSVHGSLNSNVEFEAELAFINRVNYGFDKVRINSLVNGYSERRTLQHRRDLYWKFRLANLRLYIGDFFLHRPPPPEVVPVEKRREYSAILSEWDKSYADLGTAMPEFSIRYKGFPVRGEFFRKRIIFNLGGRTWLLDDDLSRQDISEVTNQPILSGTLSTRWMEHDTEQVIEERANQITELLTFALARDVKVVSSGCFNNEGESERVTYRSPGLLPFNHGGSATIDNWQPRNLKTFLEVSDKPFANDRDWWSTSIGLLNQARGAKYLQVKCSLLNTLLDRISSKVNGDNYGNEIDSGLDVRLDRKWFRWLLHRLLRSLSKNWDQHRTDSLCDNVIRGWNAEPSFPEKVIRACAHLGIPPLSRTKLGFRHKLMHSGEMNKKLKTSDQKVEYLFEIESVVLMLMIRMLGFSGQIFLQSNPASPKLVMEFLEEQEVSR